MGSQPSKNKQFEEALQLFSQEERSQIRDIFLKISQGNEEAFCKNDLQIYLEQWLYERISASLFTYMTLVPSDGREEAGDTVGRESFLITLARLLKGSPTELTQIITFLATGDSWEKVTIKQLFDLTCNLVHLLEKNLGERDALKTWSMTTSVESMHRFVKHILHDLVYGDERKAVDVVDEDLPWDQSYSADDVEQWLSKCPLFLSILNTLFSHIFPISFVEGEALPDHVCLVPVCKGANWEKTSTLLDFPTVLLLNSSIAPILRKEWRLLFSSRQHGESFHMMTQNITHQGPSLVIVRDSYGHVFGGFASQSWSFNAQFTGDSSCMLFSLSPVLELYRATGYNDNYMYLNQGQETLPNGLGMGGQFDYFGLWLDYEYGKGHSKAGPTCTTYGSHQLSAREQFEMDAVEVWAVGPKPSHGDQQEEPGSILDKDMEAKAMLALLDRGPISEGLREDDPMADIPEEHSMPPLS